MTAFRSTNVRGLLAYLAIESAQPHSREKLAALFWPEEPESSALQNLRQSIYQLRRTLGDEAAGASSELPFLAVTRQTVQFKRETDYSVDVLEFSKCLDAGQLESAVALYKGKLLNGLFISSVEFEEWLILRRERLHRRALGALYELTEQCGNWDDYERAQEYAEQQLALEPWREEAHRQLMLVQSLSGRHSAALAQYEACREVLSRELRVEPEAETTRLYDQIRDGDPQVLAPSGPTLSSTRQLLVGRKHERAELMGEFEYVRRGRGALICVSGEPGLGKTTLIESFLATVESGQDQCLVARGSCSERLAGTEAYLPWLEALHSLMNGARGDWVSRRITALAPNWLEQVKPSTSQAGPVTGRPDEPATSQERLKREMAILLADLARHQPLLVFLDDLHWADNSTIDLLAYLAGKFSAMRVMIVTAYRGSELRLAGHPFIKVKLELQASGRCRELELKLLNRDDADAYLAGAFPGNRFPLDFAEVIYRKTEGNPLFMVDLVRYLHDRGVIAETGDGWVLADPVPDLERELPESVRSMIERKMRQLSSADRELLIAASVQGYEFDAAVVAEVVQEDVATVEERLEELQGMHVVTRLPGEDEFPDRTLRLRFRFVHVLYQNALYASLQPTRRARMSQAVAQALAAHYGEQYEMAASELAHLYETAREFRLAAHFYQVAAQHARKVFANVEAAALARRGLEMLRPLPDTVERAQLELGLELTLGFALSVTEGYAARATGESIARARTLCEQLGETPQLVPALWGLLVLGLVAPNFQEARTLGSQLEHIAESAQDPVLMSGAHTGLGFALVHLGDLTTAHGHLERVISLWDPSLNDSYRALYGLDPGLYCLTNTIRTLWLLGYPDQSRIRMQEAIARAEAARSPRSLAFALHLEVVFRLFYGEVDLALKRADVCLSHCREYSIAQEREWTRVYCGAALVSQGQIEEGIAEMSDAINSMRAMRSENTFPHFLALLGDALGRAGRFEQALACFDEAFEIAERTGDRCYEAEVQRLKGELLLHSPAGDMSAVRSEAERCFQTSLDISRRQGTKAWELRAATSLACFHAEQQHCDQARRTLAEVYEWFTEGFATADLMKAKALLDEC